MIKIFTTFSGYDSQCLAFKYGGVDFDLIGWSEIDNAAIQAHNILFPEYKDRNYGDICKIDWDNVPDFDFLTYSSPCTDISIAGMNKGIAEGSGTRSSLLWEVEKAIVAKRPKYLLMENVPDLVGSKYKDYFNKWLDRLDGYGYKSYWKVLKATDYDVPQKRKRVFCVSIRKDIQQCYEFPKPIPLSYGLHNIFDDNVSTEYNITYDKEQNIISLMKDFDYWMPNIRSGEYRIRHITPNECFKLMGLSEEDSQKIVLSSIPKSKQYFLAGNSIVVHCLIHIYEQLFTDENFFVPERPIKIEDNKKVMIGYSRTNSGSFKNRHPITESNTITTFTGNGWSTDVYIFEIP